MTDREPTQVVEPRVLVPAELVSGYALRPTEAVAFDIPLDADRFVGNFEGGNPIIANIQLGGSKTGPKAVVFELPSPEYPNDPDKNKFLITIPYIGKNGIESAATARFDTDGLAIIGRGQQGQEDLDDTVSRRHCSVRITEDRRMIVENHNPTNRTVLSVPAENF